MSNLRSQNESILPMFDKQRGGSIDRTRLLTRRILYLACNTEYSSCSEDIDAVEICFEHLSTVLML